MKIDIRASAELSSIEGTLRDLPSQQGDEVLLRLARNFRPTFFLDSCVASLIGTIAGRCVLHVQDWGGGAGSSSAQRFREDLPGLAALVYAARITTEQDRAFEPSQLRAALAAGDGRFQPEGSRSVIYCAFDSGERHQPLALAAIRTKVDFQIMVFRHLRTMFDTTAPLPEGKRTAEETELANFIFELFENSFQHGCLDARSQVIPGLRALQIRRHIATNANELNSRAEGFAELKNYFASAAKRYGHRYIEVSVSDQGLGIVNRFLATREDLKQEYAAPDSKATLINDIINKALSSKVNQPGAGHGLRKALNAVRSLEGFVSLRTGNQWLYSSFADPDASSIAALRPVATAKSFAPVRGTHFNVLVRTP